jgi:hypothetical protein
MSSLKQALVEARIDNKSLKEEIERLKNPVDQRRNQTVQIVPRTRVKSDQGTRTDANAEMTEVLEEISKAAPRQTGAALLSEAGGGLLYDVAHLPADMKPVTRVVENQLAFFIPPSS